MTTKIKSASLDNNIITTSHLHMNFSVDSDKIATNAIGPSELNQAANYTFTGTVAGAGDASIGVSQTWQNVASSRTTSTYYTNSTGRPIMVFVIYTAGTNADIDFVYTPAGGSEVSGVGLYTNSSNGRVSMSFIVPNGDQYKVLGSGNETMQQWLELR